MDKDVEIKLLRMVLCSLLEVDIGMYPKAIIGQYEKRTEFMEGWNKAVIHMTERQSELFKQLGVVIYDDRVEFI